MEFNHKNNNQTVINRDILRKGLNGVDSGETLKMAVLSKKDFSLSGHSLLVKKVGEDNYIFFDPNQGERRNLSFSALCDEIDQQLSRSQGTDIYFCRGKIISKNYKMKESWRQPILYGKEQGRQNLREY